MIEAIRARERSTFRDSVTEMLIDDRENNFINSETHASVRTFHSVFVSNSQRANCSKKLPKNYVKYTERDEIRSTTGKQHVE